MRMLKKGLNKFSRVKYQKADPVKRRFSPWSYMLAFAVVGSLLIILTHAASGGSSIEPEDGSQSGNIIKSFSSRASNGSYVTFITPTNCPAGQIGTPPNCSPAATFDYPDSSNTGYKHAPDCPSGITSTFSGTISSNTTYKCMDFPEGADVGSSSNHLTNVNFHGCRFHAVAVGEALVKVYGDNLTFDYSSFEPGVIAPPTPYNKSYQYGISADGSYGTFAQKMTVSHSDFWGFGNAIDTSGSTQAKPQVFSDNYIHDASDDGGGSYHTDGIGTESGSGTGSYVLLNHNTIVSLGNTNGIAFQLGRYDHFTITNNYLSGYGYMVALLGNATYTTFSDNVWGTDIQQVYGPLYSDFWSTTGSTWRRNKIKYVNPIYQSGDNHSGPITAADNGKFWTPNGISSSEWTGQ